MLLKCTPIWQRLILQINYRIYGVSLFAAGMTGGELIQDVLYFRYRAICLNRTVITSVKYGVQMDQMELVDRTLSGRIQTVRE
ncbi:hypothetical protein BHF51_25345 [Escherichia coli]|nr:hypothetical protein BHF51_25345 [Escherichia coli]